MISHLGLIDVPLLERRFTWASMREDSNLAKLDRILVFSDWEARFCLTTALAIKRPTSDHVPICFNLGESREKIARVFRFEK